MIRRLWLAAMVILVVPAVIFWTRVPLTDLGHPPVTPFDRTPTSVETGEWDFIWRARPLIPPHHTYTVWAPTPQLALEGYMMSLGALTDEEGFPSSYFGAPDAGARAEFILDYRCQGKPDTSLQRVAAFPTGCIYRRVQ